MNIVDVLIEAQRAVDEANLSEGLRAVAFGKAVDLIVRAGLSRPFSEQPLINTDPLGHSGQNAALAMIAKKLGLDLDTVSQVYDVENGEVVLVIPPGKLPQASAGATKEIALLVAAGYQGAGLHDWTPVGVIRRWCEEYKRLDSPNFASAIREMENTFSVKGGPRKKELRMTRAAWERATELVRGLGGGGDA